MTRDTRIERARQLRSALATGPDWLRCTDAILERFARDSPRFSDILEWSLSQDGGGVDAARFSYAFPAHRADLEHVGRFILGWAQRQGPAAEAATRSVLRIAQRRVVEQLLIGYAAGTDGEARVKLYVQFGDDSSGGAPLELARALLGSTRPTRSDHLPLHLLGLDVGRTGLAGAKLYFVDPEVGEKLAGLPRSLRNVLRIHRLRGPDDPGFEEPSELDFSLTDNELTWDQLVSMPVMAPFEAARARLDLLGSSFRLRMRRVSFRPQTNDKLNVYYVLDERNSDGKPSAGGSSQHDSAKLDR